MMMVHDRGLATARSPADALVDLMSSLQFSGETHVTVIGPGDKPLILSPLPTSSIGYHGATTR